MDSWALNFLPLCSWGQQLGGRKGQPAVRGRLLVNWRTCFDWVPVARLPHGDWRWHSLKGSGEAKFRKNIWSSACTLLNVWEKQMKQLPSWTEICLFHLRHKQLEKTTAWAFIWTKLQSHRVKLARSTVNNTIDLRWYTIKCDLLWSWEIHGSKSNQTYHQSVFEEESSLLRLATDNIYTLKSHI